MKSTLNELKSILNTVELYQDGHYHLDIQKLKQAFHPNAHIVGYYEGEQIFDGRDQYIEMLTAEKSSAELGEPSYTKLLSLDKTDTTVVVKIESLMSGTRFASQLSMLKVGDNWQIIAGLFHAEEGYIG
ncbi:MAG: nuclear transport factor 2 family protein [Thermodesulfobacteriota bacterium]